MTRAHEGDQRNTGEQVAAGSGAGFCGIAGIHDLVEGALWRRADRLF
jgi:hypothetical protein